MQATKCTFVLLLVVLVQSVLSEPCFKKECVEEHSKNSPEECQKKMSTDGKLDAEKMKAEYKKCADEKYLDKMNAFADKVNGQQIGKIEEIKKEFEKDVGCEIGL